MKLLTPKYHIVQVGKTDMDNVYIVEQEVVLNEGKSIFAGTQVDENFEQHFYVSERSLGDPKATEDDLEVFMKKEEASEAWPDIDFDMLDDDISKLIEDYFKSLDDTALHGGIRGGARNTKDGIINYVEGVVEHTKDGKLLYLQIIRENGRNLYSVTDTSMYMRMHLGPLYNEYFENKKDVAYLYEGDNLDELGNLDYLKDIFEELNFQLDQHLVDATDNGI